MVVKWLKESHNSVQLCVTCDPAGATSLFFLAKCLSHFLALVATFTSGVTPLWLSLKTFVEEFVSLSPHVELP